MVQALTARSDDRNSVFNNNKLLGGKAVSSVEGLVFIYYKLWASLHSTWLTVYSGSDLEKAKSKASTSEHV